MNEQGKEVRVAKILNHLRRAESMMEAWDRYDPEDLDMVEEDTKRALTLIRRLFADIDPDTGLVPEDRRPSARVSHGDSAKCPDVIAGRAERCPGHEENPDEPVVGGPNDGRCFTLDGKPVNAADFIADTGLAMPDIEAIDSLVVGEDITYPQGVLRRIV